MASNLNMSLEEIIAQRNRNKSNLQELKRSTGGRFSKKKFQKVQYRKVGENSQPMNTRRNLRKGKGKFVAPTYVRKNNQKKPRIVYRPKVSQQAQQANAEPATASKTRLRVSNLHFNVINSDLAVLFSSIGKLKRCGIHWDDLGRSKGTADVEYETAEDAAKAIQEYNKAELDGKQIIVEYAPVQAKVGKIQRGIQKRKNFPKITMKGKRKIIKFQK